MSGQHQMRTHRRTRSEGRDDNKTRRKLSLSLILVTSIGEDTSLFTVTRNNTGNLFLNLTFGSQLLKSTSTMKLVALFCFVWVAVVSQGVYAQDDSGTDPQYQLELQRPGEIEYTRSQDEEFDAMVGNDATRPSSNPTRNEVRREYNEQKDRILREAPHDKKREVRQDQSSMTYNPYVDYMTPDEWLSPSGHTSCCGPPKYGCTSQRLRMPCFLKRYEGSNRRQWCCVFHPDLTIKQCKCNRCALLKPNCAKEGKCRRRYKPKSFYAICYRNSRWNLIRYVTMNLPTSCYCNA